MVFQSYALYPHLTVAENIAVPLRMRRLTRAAAPAGPRALPAVRRTAIDRPSVQAVAAMLRIESLLAASRPSSRAARSSAWRSPAPWCGGRKVFLMDEPLSNLDAELRVHMRAEIAQLHRQLGATFIYVTHDQVEAMTMSDRVAVILGGAAAPDRLARRALSRS